MNAMKRFINFIKPSVLMIVGFILSVLVHSAVSRIFSLSNLANTIAALAECAVIMLALGILIDRKKCIFGFIPMIIILIAFAVFNIFAGSDTADYITLIGNWAFLAVQMLWYNAADLLNAPGFTIEHSTLINVSSALASAILVPSFMLIGSLFHRQK